jgi:hypothetical protein
MPDNTLYLRTVGGMGNRLLPLLMSLDSIERSGHKLMLNWPTVHHKKCTHPMREANFPLSVQQLYRVDFARLSDSEWVHQSRQCPSYGLRHTQLGLAALQSAESRQVPLREHADTSVAVEAHGWLNVDGEGWEILSRIKDIYDKYLKFHDAQQNVLENVLAKFEGRPVVGAYMRQLHRSLKNWNAYGKIAPKMREHQKDNPDTLFFIISECPNTVQSIREEFGEENVVTTPKPGIMNEPEEMLGVVVDIELMRHVDVYYPTWGSGMARLMSALRGEEIL